MRTERSIPRNKPPRTTILIAPRPAFGLAALLLALACWQAPARAQMEFRSGVSSLFSDDRLFKVGDVITVVIDERVQGVNNAQFRSQRGSEVQANFGAGPGKVFGLLNPFSGEVSSQNDFDSRVQNNKLTTFVTQVSARVVRTDDVGNLYLEGAKVIELPDEKQVVSLTGIVRGQDVSPQTNSVQSFQIADLRITMKGKGEAEDARRPTLFNRVFGWFF